MAAAPPGVRRLIFMIELNDFFNDGHGWICRHCDREIVAGRQEDRLPRSFREGEAESKTPELATRGLAKWADSTRSVLVCPRCGITEPVDRR